MNSDRIIQTKREQFRFEIRRSLNEVKFKERRLFDQCNDDNPISKLHKSLCLDLERVGANLLNDQAMMSELEDFSQNRILLIWCNLCACESASIIFRLINECKIHMKLMDELKQNTLNQQNETIIQALANLLFSEKKYLFNVIQYLLQRDIVGIIIKQRELIEEKESPQKEYLIRLSIAILKLIRQFELQGQITSQRLIDLFTMCVNWFEKKQELCAITIIYICDYVDCLMEVVDDSKMRYFIGLVQVHYSNENNRLASLMLIMIGKLIRTGQPAHLIELLDNCNLFDVLDETLQSESKSILQASLDIIKIIQSFEQEEFHEFVRLLVNRIKTQFKKSLETSIITQCGSILNDYMNNESGSMEVFDLLVNKCRQSYQYYNYEATKSLLKIIQEILQNTAIELNQDLLQLLESTVQSDNQKISDISNSILELFN